MIDSFRIAQLTDLHLPRIAGNLIHGIDTERTAQAVIDNVAEWQPDLLILTGDLADTGSAQAYLRLEKMLAGFNCPAIFLAGNHDCIDDVTDRFGTNTVAGHRRVELECSWDLHFLNSAIPDRDSGRLGPTTLSDLGDKLRQKPSLLFVHHHAIPVGSPWIDPFDLEDREELLALLHRDCVLVCGHVHQEMSGVSDGIHWLTSPSTCSQAIPGQENFIDDNVGPGWRWFELGNRGSFRTGVRRVMTRAEQLTD